MLRCVFSGLEGFGTLDLRLADLKPKIALCRVGLGKWPKASIASGIVPSVWQRLEGLGSAGDRAPSPRSSLTNEIRVPGMLLELAVPLHASLEDTGSLVQGDTRWVPLQRGHRRLIWED